MPIRFIPLLALAAFGLVLAACGDDDSFCSRICPPSQICVVDQGQELCLEPNCGGDVCTSGQVCVNNTCQDNLTCTGCTAAEHCVHGQCVPNYTTTNRCDPLRQCRRSCGTNLRCLNACEADAPASCSQCLGTLSNCERAESCESGAANNCCESQFCSCFPGTPGCGNVAACLDCQLECGGDVQCFNRCTPSDLVCNSCLQPFRQCQASPGADCTAQLCECLDSDLETQCR